MIHFVNEYRKRSRNWGVVECDGCGATADWTSPMQWIEVMRWTERGWRDSFHYCSDACMPRTDAGAALLAERDRLREQVAMAIEYRVDDYAIFLPDLFGAWCVQRRKGEDDTLTPSGEWVMLDDDEGYDPGYATFPTADAAFEALAKWRASQAKEGGRHGDV